MTDMSNAEFIRDLAGRMFRSATPAMGFDQGDTDRLYVIANRLAALEQAGEPVAKLHYSGDVMEAVQQLLERGRATLDSEGYLVTHPAEAPLPTLQRLGQEFDAGEVVALESYRAAVRWIAADSWDGCSECIKILQMARSLDNFEWTPDDHASALKRLYERSGNTAHSPQSRVAAEPVGLREAKFDRLTGYPDFIDDPDGLQRLRNAVERNSGHDMATLNHNSLGRLIDTIERLKAALATPSQPEPQSRGQAFDCELPLKFDPRDAKRWWEENMRESKFVSARLAGDGYVKFQWRDADESGDYSVPWTRIALWLAALSEAREAG